MRHRALEQQPANPIHSSPPRFGRKNKAQSPIGCARFLFITIGCAALSHLFMQLCKRFATEALWIFAICSVWPFAVRHFEQGERGTMISSGRRDLGGVRLMGSWCQPKFLCLIGRRELIDPSSQLWMMAAGVQLEHGPTTPGNECRDGRWQEHRG